MAEPAPDLSRLPLLIRGGLIEASKLAVILKAVVKGRHHDSYIFLDVAARESGVPAGWICSAIDARLLDYIFNMKGAEWDERGEGSMINIPVDFGLEPLDSL